MHIELPKLIIITTRLNIMNAVLVIPKLKIVRLRDIKIEMSIVYFEIEIITSAAINY